MDIQRILDANDEITSLYERAAEELPEEYSAEDVATAWVAKRILEISELDRKRTKTVQMMLVAWMENGDLGRIWVNHPNNYHSLREFLNDVGTAREGNQLSPSTISEMITLAETVAPFCRAHGIDISGYITMQYWTKFREALTHIKRLALTDDAGTLNTVLDDVRNLPTRDAVRERYRQPRSPRPAKSDSVSRNGVTVIVTVVPTEDAAVVRGALSRCTEWDTIAAGRFRGRAVDITVSTHGIQ